MKKILNILFPKNCINCKKEGSYLCDDCLSLIEVNHFQYCLCEKLEKNDKCNNCRNKHLDKLFSSTSFKNNIVKNTINKLKHSHIKELSIPLAYLILKHLQIINCKIDKNFILIPVPLFNKTKRSRGFNQSEEIAKIISETTGMNLLDCITKIKNTKTQTETKRKERVNNVKNSFRVIENLRGKNIILIDDVYVTGSTMEECAKELKKAGANIVWGVTVAREVVDL